MSVICFGVHIIELKKQQRKENIEHSVLDHRQILFNYLSIILLLYLSISISLTHSTEWIIALVVALLGLFRDRRFSPRFSTRVSILYKATALWSKYGKCSESFEISRSFWQCYSPSHLMLASFLCNHRKEATTLVLCEMVLEPECFVFYCSDIEEQLDTIEWDEKVARRLRLGTWKVSSFPERCPQFLDCNLDPIFYSDGLEETAITIVIMFVRFEILLMR